MSGTPREPVPEAPLPPPAAESEAPPPAETTEPSAAEAAAPDRDTEALRERWLRAEAELQNFRRRVVRDLEEARTGAEEGVFAELFGVADDLDRALRSIPSIAGNDSWRDGLVLISRRLQDYLRRRGVERVEPLGQPFDPRFHEALLEVDAPAGIRAGAVLEVTLPGYRRGDRALRAARVVVARAPAAPVQAPPAPRRET